MYVGWKGAENESRVETGTNSCSRSFTSLPKIGFGEPGVLLGLLFSGGRCGAKLAWYGKRISQLSLLPAAYYYD